MIGSRLKLAREAAGLSLRQLEDRINNLVSAQAIGKYERDEMMPSSPVLLGLSKALSVSTDYLLSKREVALAEIDFRRHTSSGEREQRAVEAKVLDYAERYLQIEGILPDSAPHWDAPDAKEFRIEQPQDAEQAADKLRKLWKLGIGPVNSITELLENKGVKVVEIDMPVAVSGSKAFAKQHDEIPAALIVVNSNHNGERQRFTLAHELGHLVLRFVGSMPEKQQERAADRFAGAFLMTQELLVKLVGPSRSAIAVGELILLKRYFKVSIAALVVRCGQPGILTKQGYGRAFAWLQANGLIDVGAAEPEPIQKR